MKKILLPFLMAVLGVSVIGSAHAKKFTQKDLEECKVKLKKESAKKGYPITDPMVLRYKCIEILKKAK